MRKLAGKAILVLVCLYTKQTMAAIVVVTDTTKIVHTIDGNISEWKVDSFETDKDSQMQFAVDHDANYLFVAVKISDQRTQMKMMTQGMNMYIDRKGKHKESTGINFPMAQGRDALRSVYSNNSDAQTPPDPKAIREALASKMFLLKTFGFEDREDKQQMIVDEAGISVSFDWDQENNMYIEYLVPLPFLGKNSDLNGKTISVGWQLNKMSGMGGGDNTGSAPPVVTSSRIVAVPAGSSPGGVGRSTGRSGASLPSVNSSIPKSMAPANEHIFWTKHTISF